MLGDDLPFDDRARGRKRPSGKLGEEILRGWISGLTEQCQRQQRACVIGRLYPLNLLDEAVDHLGSARDFGEYFTSIVTFVCVRCSRPIEESGHIARR